MPKVPFVVNDIEVDGTTLTVDEVNNRVGIGTDSPAVTLDVVGVIKGSDGVVTLTSDGAPSTTVADGALAVDTTNDKFYIRSGSAWVDVVDGTVVTLDGTQTLTNKTLTSPIITDGEFQDTFTIGSQVFYEQSTNGFSVNEDFDASNSSTQTAYHYTSGSGRETVVFTIARTANFTNGFGIYGTSASNALVNFGEAANTRWEWRNNVGIQPVDVDGGNLRMSLSSSGVLRINDAFSFPNSDGTSGQVLSTDGAGTVSWSAAGVTDHGALTGLADDDHTQYLLANGTRTATALTVNGDTQITGDTQFTFDTQGNSQSFRAGTSSKQIFYVNDWGVGVNDSPSQIDSADFIVAATSTGKVAVRVDAVASQTAALIEFRDSSQNVLLAVTPAGNITLSGTVDGRDIAADGAVLDTCPTSNDVDDIVEISQASYDALGSGRPANRLYLITS